MRAETHLGPYVQLVRF